MALTQVSRGLLSTSIVDNGNATAITIDSSENVLVGTTDTAPGAGDTNEGFSINSSRVFVSRASDYSLSLNRTTDDGPIALFRKDGSTVGSIGSKDSNLVIGTGDTGVRFSYGTDSIFPIDTATGNGRDAAVDLGLGSGGRFKDLYLSGGAYLGGTGSANKLDDYEEGTWTPAFTGTITAGPTVSGSSTASGTYVKVGSQVTCYFSIDFNDNSTNFGVDQRFSLEGLPFNPAQGTIASAGTWWAYASIGSGNNAFGQVGTQNDDTIYFYVTHLDGGISYGAPLIGSITFSV